MLVPPLRYACVCDGVYRGSYPHQISSTFFKRLELGTVVSVTPEELPEGLRLRGVKYVHLVSGAEQKKSKKKRAVPLTHDLVTQVLDLLKSKDTHPVFLHCLNGQQVTSLIIACFRVSCGWSVRSALREFARFGEYGRSDIAFIEEYAKLINNEPESAEF